MGLFDLDGKVAIVTGGGRGLGRAMAVALAEAGADVVIASRTTEQLDEALEELRAHPGEPLAWPCDVADPAGVQGLVEEVVRLRGGIDVLVHAAGNQVRKHALDVSAEEWDAVQAVHLRAGFLLSRDVGAHMIERGRGGKIIYVSSLTATIGLARAVAYSAAKSGLEGLMRTLALEWAPHGICVNAIAPGYIHTELTDAVLRDPERRAWALSRIPMGRLGEPTDLAGATVFLASAASDYVTGQSIVIDGGWLAS